ncbi:RNA polymerase subunit AC19, variant 2 [Purpureocillium takamizusanense]|uniref:RNA polymerase subunit AC19, variant 2 n=1 Tax=Purpureocillium takamizusanense TaxID=2060973 RepID=A0A9Q8V626_9HYPO|nr:RNA polymerase subunit AC19, variant 2 [Purpureocillium takamizusanense]UNI14390.1 RNA polymerase subunit AC19, variant 2 [Purpureocillium takamizusanense]
MPGRTKRPDEAASQDDASMQDAPPSAQPEETPDAAMEDDEQEDEDEDEEDEVEAQRVKILPGSTDTAASFEFIDEGHTLGNALRYVIMKNPDVEFCAYAIPHPSEPKMNIRIQTYGKDPGPHDSGHSPPSPLGGKEPRLTYMHRGRCR